MDVGFSSVCPVMDDEFRHNIVKVAVDSRSRSFAHRINHKCMCLSTYGNYLLGT